MQLDVCHSQKPAVEHLSLGPLCSKIFQHYRIRIRRFSVRVVVARDDRRWRKFWLYSFLSKNSISSSRKASHCSRWRIVRFSGWSELGRLCPKMDSRTSFPSCLLLMSGCSLSKSREPLTTCLQQHRLRRKTATRVNFRSSSKSGSYFVFMSSCPSSESMSFGAALRFRSGTSETWMPRRAMCAASLLNLSQRRVAAVRFSYVCEDDYIDVPGIFLQNHLVWLCLKKRYPIWRRYWWREIC